MGATPFIIHFNKLVHYKYQASSYWGSTMAMEIPRETMPSPPAEAVEIPSTLAPC